MGQWKIMFAEQVWDPEFIPPTFHNEPDVIVRACNSCTVQVESETSLDWLDTGISVKKSELQVRWEMLSQGTNAESDRRGLLTPFSGLCNYKLTYVCMYLVYMYITYTTTTINNKRKYHQGE